jgi:hypothetical protein
MEGAAEVQAGPPRLLSSASFSGMERCPPPTFFRSKDPGKAYCPEVHIVQNKGSGHGNNTYEKKKEAKYLDRAWERYVC